jgi:hypothetical protein
VRRRYPKNPAPASDKEISRISDFEFQISVSVLPRDESGLYRSLPAIFSNEKTTHCYLWD